MAAHGFGAGKAFRGPSSSGISPKEMEPGGIYFSLFQIYFSGLKLGQKKCVMNEFENWVMTVGETQCNIRLGKKDENCMINIAIVC